MFRCHLGRSILLGLELPVRRGHHPYSGSDSGVGQRCGLALMVIIRTFLRFSLEREITGRRPCQKRTSEPPTLGGD